MAGDIIGYISCGAPPRLIEEADSHQPGMGLFLKGKIKRRFYVVTRNMLGISLCIDWCSWYLYVDASAGFIGTTQFLGNQKSCL
jgi:hypothetical protein